MYSIESNAVEAIQPELEEGESIAWAAQPDDRVVFHREDFLRIPWSLVFASFTIFWECSALGLLGDYSGKSWFAAIFGIPFVLAGQFMLWARFFLTRWKKHKTFYAVTDRRVILVQCIRTRKAVSYPLNLLPSVIKENERNDIGSIRFVPVNKVRSAFGRDLTIWDEMQITALPVLRDIREVDSVERLINDRRMVLTNRSKLLS